MEQVDYPARAKVTKLTRMAAAHRFGFFWRNRGKEAIEKTLGKSWFVEYNRISSEMVAGIAQKVVAEMPVKKFSELKAADIALLGFAGAASLWVIASGLSSMARLMPDLKLVALEAAAALSVLNAIKWIARSGTIDKALGKTLTQLHSARSLIIAFGLFAAAQIGQFGSGASAKIGSVFWLLATALSAFLWRDADKSFKNEVKELQSG